jgi:uncharacterized protein (TIRG00374 family)
MTMVSPVSDRHWKALIASVVLAAFGYLAFSLWGGWHEVTVSVARVGWGGVAVLLALSLLNYGLRFLRWQLYLKRLGSPQAWQPSLLIYLGGFALTTTPGKAGEALRSVFLKARGMDYGRSVAAFLSERLSDLLAVVLLCLLGVREHPALRTLVLVAVGLLMGIYLLIAQEALVSGWRARLATRSGRLPTLLGRLLTLLQSTRRCHTPAVLLAATGLSMLAWTAEAHAFHLLLSWLGSASGWSFAYFVYAIGMLAGALSFMPGGLGGTEATMTGLLMLDGHSQALAVVATVLIRLTTLWFAVVLGMAALLRLLRQQADTRQAVGRRP